MFDDADFGDFYPKHGQPAYVPCRLALVTLLQFREGLSDRQLGDDAIERLATRMLDTAREGGLLKARGPHLVEAV